MFRIQRGDIYYVKSPPSALGSEQMFSRPAVVVSNNANNKFSPNVEVVYLTSQSKKPLPTHTAVACKVPSTALCENIMTISKERLGNYIRTCSEQEMSCIDTALLNSLGITPNPIGGGIEETAHHNISTIETERNLYKTLYEQIIGKLIGGNKND